MVLESEIHKKLEKIIEAGNLADHISNFEEYVSEDKGNYQENFCIDSLVHENHLAAIKTVLESLHGLSIISSDQNISKTNSEVLRPDFLTFDHETSKMIVFELKASVQTERQALTELLAYDAEIKNTVPLLHETSILYVLLATEWSTLLNHSVQQLNCWTNKKILPLLVTLSEKDELELKIVGTTAWDNSLISTLNKDCFDALTLYAYQYEDSDLDLEEREKLTQTALQMIINESNKENLCGYLCLWRDTHPISYASGGLHITFVYLNPFKLFPKVLSAGAHLKKKKSKIESFILESVDLDLASEDIPFKVVGTAMKLLQKFSSPSFEDLIPATLSLKSLEKRATIQGVFFVGQLGNLAQKVYVSEFERLDLRRYSIDSPEFALPFIEELSDDRLFPNGFLNARAALELGIKFGQFRTLIAFLKEDPDNILLLSIFTWKKPLFIGWLRQLAELNSFYDFPSLPEITISLDFDSFLVEIDRLIKLIECLYLGSKEESHLRMIFCLGRDLSECFDPLFSESRQLPGKDFLEIIESLYSLIERFVQAHGLAPDLKDVYEDFVAVKKGLFERKEKDADAILCHFRSKFVTVCDQLVPTKFRKPKPLFIQRSSKELKEKVLQNHSHNPNLNYAVKITPSGDICIAHLSEKAPVPHLSQPKYQDQITLIVEYPGGMSTFTVKQWDEFDVGFTVYNNFGFGVFM